MVDYIIPFKGENYSLAYDVNLLIRISNIYLMDNHKMALWCWSQQMDLSKQYNLIHIDRHSDCICEDIDDYSFEFTKNQNFKKLSAVEFDNLCYDRKINEANRVFTWNNYLPIFYNKYLKNVKTSYFFVHEHESIHNSLKRKIEVLEPDFLFGNYLQSILDENKFIIINLDIDYFFDTSENNYKMLFSNDRIQTIFEKFESKYNDPNCIFTIALSPECCGNWKNSIDFISEHFKLFDLKKHLFV